MHRPTPRERAYGYLVAVAAAGAGVLSRYLVGDASTLVFVTFYPAILASAWWGGRGPSILCVVLCALAADYLWLPPAGSLAIADPRTEMNLLLFVAVSAALAMLTVQLRETQRRFRSLLEATSEGFAIVDRLWVCAYANPRFVELLGLSTRDVVRKPIWDVLPPEVVNDLEGALRAGMRGAPSPHVVHPAPLGRTLHTAIYSTREGIALLTRDITAQQDLDTRRAALVAELEAANRLKDEFLATLSHELRTPLQAILGWVQVLADGGSTSAQGRAVDAIHRNALSLKRLVNDMLDSSRIESGKLSIERKPTSLAAVAFEAIETVRTAAEEKGVRLEIENEATSGWVHGDSGRLKQALVNLLANAVKFTGGGGRVRLRLFDDGSVARIVVEDTGVGISPELLPHVFDRFVQAKDPMAAGREGLGLGLAIAKHLVEAHGGVIHASSDGPMLGASFTVDLPLFDVAKDRQAMAHSGT